MKELYLVKDSRCVRIFTEVASIGMLNIMRYYPYGYTRFDDDCEIISCDSQMLDELKDEWRAFYRNPESYDESSVAECVFEWCKNRCDERAILLAKENSMSTSEHLSTVFEICLMGFPQCAVDLNRIMRDYYRGFHTADETVILLHRVCKTAYREREQSNPED